MSLLLERKPEITKQEGMLSFIDNVCSKNDELCVFLLKRFIWNDAELLHDRFFSYDESMELSKSFCSKWLKLY